ncbi:MAG: argininosuccinate lyase [Candidatus Sumerlaeota bacterium]
MAQAKNTQTAGPVWSRRIASEAGKANVAYCAGWDVRQRAPADLALLPWDLWTNRAHCTMLARAGVIPPAKLKRILKALKSLETQTAEGAFALNPGLEDVHLNVEAFVEENAGVEVAGLMHTARSRNDQVATDMRLFLRHSLLEFCEALIELLQSLRQMMRKHAATIMPGLTHQQPAAWTTLGHWAASHAMAFARDAQALVEMLNALNVCPLGAAASYGTSWPIDRKFSAKLLGFDGVQENSLDCVTNRSEFEARVAALLSLWANHAATLSQDLILFSSPPWQLLRIGDGFVTGSSIMPQKRNPDFAEVTKAKAALAGATASALTDLTRGDPSGYNREQQWSKYLVMDIFSELGPAPLVLKGAIESITIDKKRMRSLLADDYLEAADVADYLAQTRRVAFRQTYRWLGEAVRLSEENNTPLVTALNSLLIREEGIRPLDKAEAANLSSPDFLLSRRLSQGGPSPESVRAQASILTESIRSLRGKTQKMRRNIDRAKSRLAKAIEQYQS